MKKQFTRVLSFMFILSFSFMLTGCITARMWGSHSPEFNTTTTEQFSDTIQASFKFRHFDVKRDSTVKYLPSYYSINDGIGLVGEKYVYLVTEGSSNLESLNNIIQKMPSNKLQLTDEITKIRYLPPDENHSVPRFENSFDFKVIKSPILTDDEITLLKENNFELFSGDYSKRINFSGIILKREELKFNYYPENNLAMKYKITFYKEDTKMESRPDLAARNVLLTPFTLVADVVSIPIAIIATPIYLIAIYN